MSETTTKPAPRQRKKPVRKPERFCKLVRQGENVVLTIRQRYPRKGDVLDTYTAEAFPSEMGGRGIELTKPDGAVYHVRLDGTDSECSCKGFEEHGWHADDNGEPTACKHVMALLALQQRGKL